MKEIIRLKEHDISFTKRIIGLDWESYCPKSLTKNILVKKSNYSNLLDFLISNGESVSGKSVIGFNTSDDNGKKFEYYQITGDFFDIYEDDKIIGVFLSNLSDWSTYYLRFTSFLPEYRGKGIYPKLLEFIISILSKYKINRIEADISLVNVKHQHTFMKLGFFPNGMTVSDRWGSCIKMTRFLNEESMSTFENQLCAFPWSLKKEES